MNTLAVDALAPLREWLLATHPHLQGIGDDVDLFASKLIDSINFVEFILILEEIIDREIPVSGDLVQKTSTLRSVAEHFLGATTTT